MSFAQQYAADVEFCKLLTRAHEVNLTIAALELARDFCPGLEFDPDLDWIGSRAGELAGPLAKAKSDRELLSQLSNCLAGNYGITGQQESYESADGSFLNRVIELKTGIPISLSLLYMAVSNEAGLPLYGVSSPGHFLTRYEGTEGVWFVDAFHGGRILTLAETLTRVEETSGLAPEVAYSTLEKASARTTIIRMLNNLKALFSRQEEWKSAFLVQSRLTALQPASYNERRDLAVLTLHARQPGRAIDLLETCLEVCPRDERPLLQQKLAEARRQCALCN